MLVEENRCNFCRYWDSRAFRVFFKDKEGFPRYICKTLRYSVVVPKTGPHTKEEGSNGADDNEDEQTEPKPKPFRFHCYSWL